MKKEDIHKKASRASRAGTVICPGCRKTVYPDEEFHYSVTKRKSIIIWYCKCTNLVWKERKQ